MQLWMYMAWQMSSPCQALQLVCITLPSVFIKSSFLVSQVKKLIVIYTQEQNEVDYLYGPKFLVLFSDILLCSSVLDIKQILLLLFSEQMLLLLPEY